MMSKNTSIVLGLALILIVVGLVFWSMKSSKGTMSEQTASEDQLVDDSTTSADFSFSDPKKSAHYETNTPAHGAVLAGVPVNVVVDFNFDLAKPSEIQVYSSGVKNPKTGTTSPIDITVGETIIDSNKLSMRRAIDPNAPDDKYTVEYKACWPDGSCHNGSFEFVIDRSKASQFSDQTGKKEVTIKLSKIQFNPQNIKVSKGTKVVWVNDDDTQHYVNTDSHPAHTYYPAQNSKALKKGDSFNLTFDTLGIYPYHCSAHASSMVGSLLVE